MRLFVHSLLLLLGGCEGRLLHVLVQASDKFIAEFQEHDRVAPVQYHVHQVADTVWHL